MSKPTDARITGAELYLLPVLTRVPLLQLWSWQFTFELVKR